MLRPFIHQLHFSGNNGVTDTSYCYSVPNDKIEMTKNFIMVLDKFCTYFFGIPGIKEEISPSVAVPKTTLEENSLTNVYRKDCL